MNEEDKKINRLALEGSGGGGKGGGSSYEEDDNQFSEVLAKVLIAYSSGETDGLIDGTNSIFLDNTRLTGNFQGVKFAQRNGSPGQSALKGFEQSTTVQSVGVELTQSNPITRTVSSADVDSVRVIVTLPSLQKVEKDGDIKNTQVDLVLEVRDPATGLWEERSRPEIYGKSSGPFQQQFTIDGPNVITDAWDWRITRLTPDSDTSRMSNETTVQSVVEIRLGKETYPGTAYMGLEFDTADFGSKIPAIAFEVRGVRVRVPSNYTDIGDVPTYSGVWDGTWTYSATENPVWHIYNLLTDNEVGLGLDDSYIDRYNFYEAARYCDAVDESGAFVGIPDGNGGVRRRFTLNTQISGQKDGLEMLQDIASSMRAVLYFGAGAVVLKQDMPRATSRIITNENVKDGTFFYSSTPAKDRITIAKVGYNNPDDNYLINYVRYPEASEWDTDPNIARYGKNEVEVTKFGCTSEAEAQAYAQWLVYTSCYESRTVTFTGSMECMLLRPGDVIEVSDRRLAGAANFNQRFGGRIAGGTATTVNLDYEVELSANETYEITIVAADGKTLETREITTGAGTVTSVTVDSAFTDVPTTGYTWLIKGTDIVPQKFSIIHTERKDGLEVEVFAIQYDDQKFAAVEQNIPIIPKPYTRIDLKELLPPQNATFQVIPRIDAAKGVMNSLLVKWDPSPSEYVTRYKVRYRKNNGPWKDGDLTAYNEFEIADVTESTYDVLIYGETPLGTRSPALQATYTVVYGESQFEWMGEARQIQPPTITTPATFNGKDLVVEWTRNPANDIPGIVFKEYAVDFVVGGTVVRSITTVETKATYYFDDMVDDQNTDFPSRNITVRVRERDALLHESINASRAFTNPTPQAPAFKVKTGFNHASVDITPVDGTDIRGYYVFRGSSAGFTANASSQVHKGIDTSITDTGLDEGTTYYYKVAAYDVFGEDISGLIVSGAISADTQTVKGVLIDYNFEDIKFTLSGNRVYWTAGSYVKTVGDTVTTGTTTAGNKLWTSGTLYIYYDDITGNVATSTNLVNVFQGSSERRILASYDGNSLKEGVNEPIIDGANILAQTVGATQVVSSGLITNTAQINNGIIENANIKDATIDNAKIVSLDAEKIRTGSLLASETITSEGIIQAVNGDDSAGIGQKFFNSKRYLMWGEKNGNLQFGVDYQGNAEFAGKLQAASGTFAGSLQAASGTFSGSLQAASGTFGGTLTAANGTFNGTLTLGRLNSDKMTIKSSQTTSYGKSVAIFKGNQVYSGGSTVGEVNIGGFHMPGSLVANSNYENFITTNNGVHIIFSGLIQFRMSTWIMEYRRTVSTGAVGAWTHATDAPTIILDEGETSNARIFTWSFGLDLFAIASPADRYIEFRIRKIANNGSTPRLNSWRIAAWYSNL